MSSTKSNRVWVFVELPSDVKAMGCKWVFETKKDSLGNIKRYETRLVAMGFTQEEKIDYTKILSPISKKDFLCIILALLVLLILSYNKRM